MDERMNTRGARVVVGPRFYDLAAGTAMPPQLVRYWLTHIAWGVPGDFMKCVTGISQEAAESGHPISDRKVKGACATLHKMATGFPPGKAPGERSHKG
jgi:hypothetical protein